MKTKLILAILLICMAGLLFGSENPAEMDEMQRRTQELKALSERFKADKGFEGVIETNTEVMKLSHFRGNFKDIDMSGVSDTLAFRQVCNRVISKLLPYIGAKENQLDAGKISISSSSIRTQYQQRVNGYPIEGAGRLVVSYEKDYNRISILNVTVDIGNIEAMVKVPIEKAIEVAHKELGLEADEEPYKPRIAYSCNPSFSVREFTLCYILTFRSQTAYVGTESGTVLFIKTNKIVRSTNVNVVGEVYEKVYINTDQMTTHLAPILSAFVESPIDSAHTGPDGNAVLADDSFTWMKASLSNYNLFSVKKHPNTNTVMQQAELDNLNHVTATFDDDQFHSVNTFYHAVDQQACFESMGMDNETFPAPYELAIITGYPYLEGGNYNPSNNMIEIGLDYGKLSHVVRHELSHANVHEVLQGHLFNDINDYDKDAMDESMAVYLQCAGINSPFCIYGIPNSIERIDIINTLSTVLQQPINEEKYSMYEVRHTIASAWWTLRSNPIFGSPDPITQVKAFDKALVEVLATDVDESFSDRYKPRYFYNLLMTKYSTDNQTWTLNEKQIAIKDAYNSRGLNFYPKVESISEYSKERNVFGLNEPVHVKISNCPQNTAANIYIVKHNEYTYTDGALLPTLSSHFPSGFSPLTSVVTSPLGEWEGFLWTTAEEGEFDIIVDFGSPSTPDGIIRFSFSGANVMDGFDGRTMPGFRVTGLAGIATNSLNELYTSSLQIAISD